MRRILLITLLSAGLVGLTGLAGGVWLGGRIERIGTAIEPLRFGAATLKIDDFQRGWLHSATATRLTIPTLPPLRLHQRLTHNPLNGQLLHLDGRPAPDSVWCGAQLGDCDATRLSSRLSWFGGQRHALSLPALTLPNLTLSGLSGNLRLGPWTPARSTLALTVDRLVLAQPRFVLESATLRAELAAPERHLRLALETAARTARLQDFPPGGIDLIASADRVDRDALTELATSSHPADALLAGQRLLRGQPRLRVARLDWRTAHGELHLNGELSLRAINPLRLLGGAGPLELIETGAGELRIDRPLAERLLTRWPSVAERLARWLAAGFVRLDNNVYHLRFRIDNQGLLLNGIAVAPSP